MTSPKRTDTNRKQIYEKTSLIREMEIICTQQEWVMLAAEKGAIMVQYSHYQAYLKKGNIYLPGYRTHIITTSLFIRA